MHCKSLNGTNFPVTHLTVIKSSRKPSKQASLFYIPLLVSIAIPNYCTTQKPLLDVKKTYSFGFFANASIPPSETEPFKYRARIRT